MVFPFGISVSDFIAGIKLFKDAIDSLSTTRGARADFAELSRSLSSLERALEALGKVELSTDQHAQALKQNLDACKFCIAKFLEEIAKFQKLDANHVKTRKAMIFRQIQWALCKRDDVIKFRSQIETHVGALEMLLITFKVESIMRVDDRTTKIETSTNGVVKLLESYSSEVKQQRNVLLEFQDKLKTGLTTDEQRIMFNLLQESLRQNEDLRQEMKNLQTQNNTLVHHVLDIKNSLHAQRSLPSQVLLQQPVVLHDALGRIAPFHLEFIDSVAAFLAVLKIRFEHVGRPKITRLEFDLRDSTHQSQISLRKSWNGVFRPGQHVDMSMMFARSLDRTCPGCHYEEQRPFKRGELVQCPQCFTTYDYRIGQDSDHVHFSGDSGINNLLPLEDGKCDVSDFSRVSIVEPRSSWKTKLKGKSQESSRARSKGKPRRGPGVKLKTNLKVESAVDHTTDYDGWACDTCGAHNSGLTPDFCPICGSNR